MKQGWTYKRLNEVCEEAGIPVYRWHGDVSQSQKMEGIPSAAALPRIVTSIVVLLSLKRLVLETPLL